MIETQQAHEPAAQQDIQRQDLANQAPLSYMRDFYKRVSARVDGVDGGLDGIEEVLGARAGQ